MRVQRITRPTGRVSFELLDDADLSVPEVSGFLRYLESRDYSPHTISAYAYDFLHFSRFLAQEGLTYAEFRPAHALALVAYLRAQPGRRLAQRLGLSRCTTEQGQPATCLSAPTVNRILAAISSLYEYLIISEQLIAGENPIQKREDLALARVSERHRPFMGQASRQHPIRRMVRVKTVERLPRPMSDEHVQQLLSSLTCLRDKAMILLMLQGGLRPGEVLNLHLEDVQYGRRRVIIRYRTDHPKGVRTKSRRERVVDLHEPETLATLSKYVLHERPTDTHETCIFLVGGKGKRRCEPLSYHALVKLFTRHCERVGIREAWMTPHSLRHTHATRMFEQGMRELTLQKRLGHSSPDSTRVYTRVSDPIIVAEYRQALGYVEET
jgi:integrase